MYADGNGSSYKRMMFVRKRAFRALVTSIDGLRLQTLFAGPIYAAGESGLAGVSIAQIVRVEATVSLDHS